MILFGNKVKKKESKRDMVMLYIALIESSKEHVSKRTLLHCTSAFLSHRLTLGGTLHVEALDFILNDITFDSGNIKLWKKNGKQ